MPALNHVPSYILTDAEYLAAQQMEAELITANAQLASVQAELKVLDETFTAYKAGVDQGRATLEAAIAKLTAERDDLLARIAAIEAVVAQSMQGYIPFTFPPMQYNSGSWPDAGTTTVVNGVMVVRLKQSPRTDPRVLRRDYGFDNPSGGGFLNEPSGKLRRYSMMITIPTDYNPIEMNNWWQWHTASAKMSPYLSFFGWTSTTRWRHIKPDGSFTDYNKEPYKFGHTYKCVVEAKWSQGNDGVLRVWEDDKNVIDYVGPTFRSDETKAPYVLHGQYFPNVAGAFDNTVIFSDYRIVDL